MSEAQRIIETLAFELHAQLEESGYTGQEIAEGWPILADADAWLAGEKPVTKPVTTATNCDHRDREPTR